jgi:hypothetical protein
VDPARQFASPYLGMGNNPINGLDPDGAKFNGTGIGFLDFFIQMFDNMFSDVFSNKSETYSKAAQADNIEQSKILDKEKSYFTAQNIAYSTPYISINFGKNIDEISGSPISFITGLTLNKYGLYANGGTDLTYSGTGVPLSLSLGWSFGPPSEISGYSIGVGAGINYFGVEASRSLNGNPYSGFNMGSSSSVGVVISGSPYWVSGNATYTFPISSPYHPYFLFY